MDSNTKILVELQKFKIINSVETGYCPEYELSAMTDKDRGQENCNKNPYCQNV